MIELHFDNWHLTQRANTPPAYQYDNDTIPVIVTGNIPEGWTWELLLAHGEYLDVAHMDATEDGLVVVLTAEQLAFDGYYTAQLRASQDDKVKHSSPVLFSVGDSLSGDEQWPEIPTAFTQALERAEAAITAAEGVAQTVTQARDDAVSAAQDAADSKAAAAGSASEAAGSAEDAEDAAQSAEAAVERYPRISAATGNWERWQEGEWVDTGVHAEGPQGPQGEPGEVSEAELHTGLATKADKTALAYTDKRLSYLYELTQGQAWDTEAGTSPAYQQSVPAGAKATEIGSIGGKTVVWNQLLPVTEYTNTRTDTRTYISLVIRYGASTSSDVAVIENIRQASNLRFFVSPDIDRNGIFILHNGSQTNFTIYNSSDFQWKAGHKYFFSANIVSADPTTIGGSVFENMYFIDFTQHFGAGSEPTDTSDPRIAGIISWAEAHPEFDAGSLMSAKVTEVESVGKNLFDASVSGHGLQSALYYNVLGTDHGYNGEYLAAGDYTLSLAANGNVYFYVEDVVRGIRIVSGFYGTSKAFTIDESSTYAIWFYSVGIDQMNVHDVQLERGSTATAYAPYVGTLGTLEIPAALRTYLADKGYGWSAGTVYNELNLEAKKYIQRVGSRAHAEGDEDDPDVVTDGTTTYYPLATPVEYDISSYLPADNLLTVEAGGSLTFVQDGTELEVPNSVDYLVNLSEAI